MDAHFTDISTRLLSPRLWRGIGLPTSMNPLGSSYQSPSGNPAFGFFDDFHSFHLTTLEGPYLILRTGTDSGITIEQIPDTAERKGLLAINLDAGTTADEAVIQWGRGLGAPFKLADKDLAFECCISVSAITTSEWNIGVGLGDVGMGATTAMWASDVMAAAADFLGFAKVVGETTGSFDGVYQDAGGDYVDGATKTKLDAIATFTASATTYKKLGFRYRAHPQTVEWYVDGALAIGTGGPAKLTSAECDVADTFPDDVFLAPILGIWSQAGNAALQVNMDWWGCAQYE